MNKDEERTPLALANLSEEWNRSGAENGTASEAKAPKRKSRRRSSALRKASVTPANEPVADRKALAIDIAEAVLQSGTALYSATSHDPVGLLNSQTTAAPEARMPLALSSDSETRVDIKNTPTEPLDAAHEPLFADSMNFVSNMQASNARPSRTANAWRRASMFGTKKNAELRRQSLGVRGLPDNLNSLETFAATNLAAQSAMLDEALSAMNTMNLHPAAQEHATKAGSAS
jgi:hypothetical protein